MPPATFSFAVRLIGFADRENAAFEANFAAARVGRHRYFRLEEDNLQDPDLYLVNGGELKALVRLADLGWSEIRPVLLVGSPEVDLPYPRVGWPIDWPGLFGALDALIECRADALARLEASDIVAVPERRRRSRLDLDLTDPAEYLRMRAKAPGDGAVLIVDRNPAFRDYLAGVLARQDVPVAWAGDEARAAWLCRQQPVAVVMINTSTPGVDPYRLCRAIKAMEAPLRVTVIFLAGKPFVYDVRQARQAGVDGFLNKPLAGHHLLGVLKKFLPFR